MRLTAMKKRLGDILVDVGIISPEQLQHALDLQKRTGGKLGTILSQMGVINEEVMLAFLGKQCGVSYVSLAEYGEIPDQVIRAIPEQIARHQNLLPIAIENNTITVAMSDPFNIFAVDDVRLMTGCDIQVVIASENEIRSAILKYYSHQPDLENILLNAGNTAGDTDISHSILAALIDHARHNGAHEILLEPYGDEQSRVRYRIDGTMHEQALISREMMELIYKQLFVLSAGTDAAERDVSFQVNGDSIPLTYSTLHCAGGERVMIRMRRDSLSAHDITKLGFEQEVLGIYKRSMEKSAGLVLVTGPFSSGKKSTLTATLEAMNYPDRDIVSISKDMPRIINGVSYFVVDPARGMDLDTIVKTLRVQQPGIVVFDELRDGRTAAAALDFALRGARVYAAMVADSPADAITRIAAMDIEPYLIASGIVMIINQRLMRTICPDCITSYEVSRASMKSAGIDVPDENGTDKVTLKKGLGCPKCNFSGYLGRTAVAELIEIDDELKAMISGGESLRSITSAIGRKSALPLSAAALRKVLAGISTAEEMLRVMRM